MRQRRGEQCVYLNTELLFITMGKVKRRWEEEESNVCISIGSCSSLLWGRVDNHESGSGLPNRESRIFTIKNHDSGFSSGFRIVIPNRDSNRDLTPDDRDRAVSR